MRIDLYRIDHDIDSTTGYMKIDGIFECFTLEDEYRKDKVRKETRIPPGVYKILKRRIESPLTIKYRKKRPWFDFHLQLQDVPNFNYVYMHVGNTDDHTDGCILVGDTLDNRGNISDFLGNSNKAFERVYLKISSALDINEEVEIHIHDQ